MGCLGANFCGDFDEIREVLGHRLRESGRSSCLAVIVFANERTPLFKEHLGPYIAEWHFKSKSFVEFVFPGYRGLGDPTESDFKADMYGDSFQESVFVRAIEEFQARSGWFDTGEPAMLICNARVRGSSAGEHAVADLQLSACVVFDLAEALRAELIRSVPVLFHGIIRFAKENPAHATSWDVSDTMGIRYTLDQFKEGLVKSFAKWLKLEDLTKTLRVAECFAVRNLERQ